MTVLLATLILLTGIIALSSLNPGFFTLNLFGLVLRNVPISLFMLLFLLLGILLAGTAIGSKYVRLKKKYYALLRQTEGRVEAGGPDDHPGNRREDPVSESRE